MGLTKFKTKVKNAINCLVNGIDPPRIILTYHRIGTDQEPDPACLSVSQAHFTEQLAVLEATCTIVPLEQISTAKKRVVAITFDDGYADILHRAAPLLAAHQMPATVFVTTGFMDSQREAWWDLLAQALLSHHPVPAVLQAEVATFSNDLPTATQVQRCLAYQRLSSNLVTLSAAEIAVIIASVSQWAGRTLEYRESHRFLTRAELVKLASIPGISIGSHGVTHVSLARQSGRIQDAELTQSKSILSEIIKNPVETFAYPFGSPAAVERSTITRAKLTGYQLAVTTNPGQVHSWSSLHSLRRHTVRDWDGPEFAQQLHRFWTRSDHPDVL